MKTFLNLIVLAGLLSTEALAQETNSNASAKPLGGATSNNEPIRLRSVEAKDHVGAHAIITGKVAEVNKGATVIRLNFDETYPKQTFTAIVFSHYTNLFPNLEQLKDKTVEVSGKIILYRSRAEIELQKTNQLRVVEVPAEAKQK
jgi:hypothetical protein